MTIRWLGVHRRLGADVVRGVVSPAAGTSLPKALRPVRVALCVYVFAFWFRISQRLFGFCGLLSPRATVLLCLDVLFGAGGLTRRLDFSCVCPGRVSAVLVVGAVLACLWLVP